MYSFTLRRPGWRGRTLRTALAGAAVAALALGTAGPASATVLPPTPVGGGTAGSLPTTPISRGANGLRAAVTPVVTCRAAEGVTRYDTGALYRITDTAPLSTTKIAQRSTAFGANWTPSLFAWVGAGGDGVLYGLTWSGALRWYRYSLSSSSWVSGSGAIVGNGFTPYTQIINIALGSNGQIYVIRTSHQLALYRHLGRLTGVASWAKTYVIGSNWNGDEVLAPNGDGTLYRQYKGALIWYRHSDPAKGTVIWKGPRTIGSSWAFYDVLPAGAGVLYATQGKTGAISMYRHADPLYGSAKWAQAGVAKGTANVSSFGISIDPAACKSA